MRWTKTKHGDLVVYTAKIDKLTAKCIASAIDSEGRGAWALKAWFGASEIETGTSLGNAHEAKRDALFMLREALLDAAHSVEVDDDR